ncbi:hypothetical protein [Variovorax sp. RCC_210]|uniref:hypothetical protein n=1 Tax=Variovorax sp. RCC_210 TaxID=3239217 RepID=UPI003524F108
MKKEFGISIERDFKPFPVLWHASACLRDIREDGGTGSYWAGLGALVTLAFAIEGFCQTEGPQVFEGNWLSGKKVEREPVYEKFKLIGKAVGANVNYGALPWSDVRRVLRARDSLAHPRPAKRQGSARLAISPDEHPIDAAAHLVMEPWEHLLELKAAKKIADNVDSAIKQIWSRMGRKPWDLHMHGTTSYVMSTVTSE